MNILMTVEELAKYLKIKPDTIYKKVRKGELPAIKLGKLLRFPKEVIDQWITEQATKTMKAKDAISHKVEEVVDEVNKRAHAASKVIGADIPELLENIKKAPLNKKQETLRRGLQDLWQDLSKEVGKKAKKARGKSTSGKGRKKKANGQHGPIRVSRDTTEDQIQPIKN